MFESIISSNETAITTGSAMLIIAGAILLGLIVSVCYILTQKRNTYSKDFVVAVAILPAIVSIVIMLVDNSVARAFSLAGAFALVRFRSAPGSAKDIAVVFLTMAVGLACGLGYLFFGAAAAGIVLVVLIILSKTRFGESKTADKVLKITIPEDLNYSELFDDLFSKYTLHCELSNVRTTNMGTLYELTYNVIMKDGANEKDFIDGIRCRNGNLNISLGLVANRNTMML